MVDLSDLTVVILSYQRQDFLVRNMAYWSNQLPTIIVVDGTERPISRQILEKMTPNIRYYWMNKSYEDRLRSVIPLIQTKYVVQLCDDEFFLPSGLEACIDELETDKQLIACVGRCIYFWPRKGKTTVINYYTWWKSILQNTPQERMEATMQAMHNLTIYSVMRSENWIKNINLITEKKFSCCYVTENQFELFSAYQGKAKLIDVLSWFRSGENHPKSFKGWNRDYHIEHWYRMPKNAAEVTEMFDLFCKSAMSVTPQTDPALVERGARKAIDIVVCKAEAGKTLRSKIKAPLRKCADMIAANLPKSIKYPLKDILGLTRDHFDYNQLPERLAKEGIKCNLGDLNRVATRLQQFYS